MGDKPIRIDKPRGSVPVLGRARFFPKLPDTDALIAELRERLTRLESKLDRALEALKAKGADDGR